MEQCKKIAVSNLMDSLKRACSLYALFLCSLAFISIISSYVFGLLQPVRWPTLVYFSVALLLTVTSVRIATWFVVFSFPLLPDLHIQISYLIPPKVPYFVGYPGVDVIMGYVLGLFAVLLVSGNLKKSRFELPPWPTGLVLLVFSASTVVAIFRNLHQTNSSFVWEALFNAIVSFKLINKLNDYYPIVELLIYSIAILFFCILIQQLKKNREPNETIFRPVIFAALLSAALGIFQALTSFGLHVNVSEYRPDGIGYGAVGFQPDLHAFGAHMLVGTVGLLGFLSFSISKKTRLIILFTIALCCVALVLSKSRTSAVFFVIATAAYLLLIFKRTQLGPHHWKWLGLFAIVAVVVFVTQSFAWIGEITAALDNSATTVFQKANEISRYRLEIFIGALRIFASAPIFGIGHGTFFRISRDQQLTGTSWFFDAGGENAHNYFLQTLAEVGLVGVFVCVLFFVYPFTSQRDRVKNLATPATWAILAIGLGNIYSHSLIVRENLFLLATFTALLYVHVQNISDTRQNNVACNFYGLEESRPRWLPILVGVIICGVWFAPRFEGLLHRLFY